MLTPDQTVALAERVLLPLPDGRLRLRHRLVGAGRRHGRFGPRPRGALTTRCRTRAARRWPSRARRVETFIHDPETLAWTFKDEAKVGRCAFRTMVAQGRLVGPRPAAGRPLKRRALSSLAKGPGQLDAARRDLFTRPCHRPAGRPARSPADGRVRGPGRSARRPDRRVDPARRRALGWQRQVDPPHTARLRSGAWPTGSSPPSSSSTWRRTPRR